MKRIALLAALLLFPQFALADYEGAVTPGSAATRSALIGCVNNTVLATVANGQQVAVQCDTSGRLITTGSSSGGSNSITGPTGNNADGVVPTATGQVPSDSYNYVFDGTNWDRASGASSIGAAINTSLGRGILAIVPHYAGGGGFYNPASNANSLGDADGGSGITAMSFYGFNGSSLDRVRTLGTSSLGILAVGINPTSAAQGSIVPVTSATSGSQSLVLKNAAGNLYSVSVDNSINTLSGKLILMNTASVPAIGALSSGLIIECVAVMTGGQQGSSPTINHTPGPPSRYTSGIVALLSTSTNCGTWTPGGISGFISGLVQ